MTVSSLMQIKENAKFFSMIPVGQAIVRLSARHFEPFLVNTPFVDLKREEVTDKAIKERMSGKIKDEKRLRIFNDSVKMTNLRKKVVALQDAVNASGVASLGDYSDLPYDKRMKKEIEDAKKVENIKAYFKFNEGSLEFIKKLKGKKMPTTHLYSLLKKTSTRKCHQYRNDLAFMDLLTVETERTKQGVKKLLSLTEKGETILGIIKSEEKKK